MTRISPLETMILLFGMALLAGLSALVLLGSAAQTVTAPTVHLASKATIDWLRPDQVHVPDGLAISAHATKHHGDTERIYQLLLEGQCVNVAKFCGGSESEFTYVCVDPITGVVGAIIQMGDEIITGYYERAGSGYWAKRIPRERWSVCE